MIGMTAIALAAPLACADTPAAALLQAGTFVYVDVDHGKTIGRDRIAIARQSDGRYGQDRVTGLRYPRHPAKATPVMVRDRIGACVIDQRIDWASVMARKLEAGTRFAFHVYDPTIGTSAASAAVEDGGRIHVPAGDFDVFKIAYRIEKKTGSERYVVFASKALPRFLVREDFPDGVSSQLEEKR